MKRPMAVSKKKLEELIALYEENTDTWIPMATKREFTYVSGNPCDPNAPKEESIEESAERESDEPENVPANYPTRPIRPLARPTAAPKQSVTFFQNNYQQEEEEQPEPEQVLRSQPVQVINNLLILYYLMF